MNRLSVRAILRDVVAAYRRYWRGLLVLALVVFGAVNLLEILLPEVELDHLDVGGAVAAVGLLLAVLATEGFSEAFYEGVVGTEAMTWRGGHAPPRLADIARSISYGTLIAVNLVLVVATAAGLLALVVPGIVVGTYLSLAPALVEIEGLGVGAALRRSVQLVRGNFWRVTLVVWVLYLTTVAIGEGVEIPLHHLVGDYVATTAVESLLAPLYGLATVFIALDLIELKGGGRG